MKDSTFICFLLLFVVILIQFKNIGDDKVKLSDLRADNTILVDSVGHEYKMRITTLKALYITDSIADEYQSSRNAKHKNKELLNLNIEIN